MPYNPVPRTFKDAAGAQVTRIAERLEPPVSPATEAAGAIRTLYDTVLAEGEYYAASKAGGPGARTRIEISIAGGDWQPLDAIGVPCGAVTGEPQEVRLRGVHLDGGAVDTEACLWSVYVRRDAGEAEWDAIDDSVPVPGEFEYSVMVALGML